MKPMKNNDNILEKLENRISKISLFSSKIVHLIIIGIGIILRIAQFLYNRSLTEGEAALALNIVQRSYSELLKPLDYVQAAPVGFLILQKFAINIFGTNEYAMRILPLIAGIISLFLFFEIAKKTINNKAIPIALILFAVGDHLIYFASEVKQYSCDVVLTLLLILITINIIKNFKNKYILLFGFVGAISFWFSHPAVFTFYAGVMVLLFTIIRNKDWKFLMWLCIASIIATTSLCINYFISLESLSINKNLSDFWQHSFMPFPPTSISDIKWFGYVFLRTFKFPVGLSMYELFLAVLSFFFGCIIMFYKKRKILLILILPIILTLFASGLHKYPFEGRLLLFITPCMILIIAQGIDYIQRKMAQNSRLLGLALVCILLIQPVILAGYRLIKPRAPEELRPVMHYLNEHHEQEDVIYVYYASLNAFQYYSSRFDYTDDYIIGIEARDDLNKYYEDLKKLKGNKRVWVLFSHIAVSHDTDEEKLIVSYLNILGTQLDEFKTSGASAYLYDLSD